ncbi:hypothetical protein LSAT2_002779 [Lamellibrachia satsuma]|nr:hypothetical protein LSAT2_002779 [Lamellibrachia satsuma]
MKLFVLLVVAITALCQAKNHHYKYPIIIDRGGLAAPNLLEDSQKDGERTELIGTDRHTELTDVPKDAESEVPWEKLPSYHKGDKALCRQLNCRSHQTCMTNSEDGQTECINKKFLRQLRRFERQQQRKQQQQEQKKPKQMGPRDFHTRSEHLKKVTRNYMDEREKVMRNKFKHIQVSFDYADNRKDKKTGKHFYNTVMEKQDKECTSKELEEMGHRLLDWFRLEQDEAPSHHKEKRNSKKKELRDASECICQAPVTWQFQQFDHNADGQLSESELHYIEHNGYEHCVAPFINACDYNKDTKLSEREWCCCFASILPPCLSAKNKVSSLVSSGIKKVIIGAYVPQCDDDGFYSPMQCHSSIGQCWCVNKHGHEIRSTRTNGELNCSGKRHHSRSGHKVHHGKQ